MDFSKVVLILCICASALAKVHFDGDKVFRITPRTKTEVKFVHEWIVKQGEAIDVWKEPSRVGAVIDVHVSVGDVDQVKDDLKHLQVKIIIEDLEKVIHEEEKSNHNFAFAGSYSYNTYNRYNAIQTELYNLASQYNNAETFVVGNTYEGRPMLGIKITHPTETGPKEAVWVDGGIHAREWISPATVMFLLRELLQSTDAVLQRKADAVLKKYDFYILPVFNADGYEYTHTGQRLWRKTRSSTSRYWCKGADPNRNWDSQFKFPPIPNSGTSTNPCSDIYRGPKAFSEVEVLNVARKLAEIKRDQGLKSYWNVHAYSQLLLFPWSYTRARATDYQEIKRVANIFSNGVRARSGKYFQVGQPADILYSVAGGSIDWTYEKLGVKYSYAPELRPTQSERYGFMLPSRFIRASGLEFCDGLFNAVLAMK